MRLLCGVLAPSVVLGVLGCRDGAESPTAPPSPSASTAQVAAASGLDYPRLVERIVNLAAERFERKR
jgi:hypothetical protein